MSNYGVIAETKLDGIIIGEQKPTSYTNAANKMKELSKSPDIIRVAMFEMNYVNGNKDLIRTEF